MIFYRKLLSGLTFVINIDLEADNHFRNQVLVNSNLSELWNPRRKIRRIFGFSVAAATLSLSFICLLMSNSFTCVPGVIFTVTFITFGKLASSFTFIISPMIWAMEQWGMVGVY